MVARAPGGVIVLLSVLLGWGVAAWLLANAAPSANAAQVRSVSTTVVHPTGEGWKGVTFHMLILDDGTVPFEEAAELARASAVARIPGGIELEPGTVSAQFLPLGWAWPGNTVGWNYNPAGTPAHLGDVFSVIASGASAWNEAGNADWRFQSPGTTTAEASMCDSEADGQNTVTWGDWTNGGAVLAVTCLPAGSSVTEFDIMFDVKRQWSVGDGGVEIDLQSVATHEFGHALGLNHSADRSAVMFASYPAGTIRREPQADDIAGLIAVYGALPLPIPTAIPTSTPTPTAMPTVIPIVDPLVANETVTPVAALPSPAATASAGIPPSSSPGLLPPLATPTPIAPQAPERILIPGLTRN